MLCVEPILCMYVYRPLMYFSDRSLEDSCGSSINSMSEYFTSQGSCPDAKEGMLLCLIVTDLLAAESNIRLHKLILFSASVGSGPLDIELRTKHHYNSLEVDSGFCGDASLQSTSSFGSGGYSSGGLGTYTSSPDSRRSMNNFIYSNLHH